MLYRAVDRDRSGMILIMSTFVIMMIFALSGAVLSFSVNDQRSFNQRFVEAEALYLAEAGLEAAKRELVGGVDPDADGLGTKSMTNMVGTYNVFASDLGGGFTQLVSNGIAGQSGVWLQVVLANTSLSSFPDASFSVVGEIDDLDFEFNKNPSLILDGGDGLAMSFADTGLYNRLGQEFADAINSGQLPAENITGAYGNSFTTAGGDVDVSIGQPPEVNTDIQDLTALYDELKTTATGMISSATFLSGLTSGTYGSEASPGTFFIYDGSQVNQTVTGYGTLIVGDQFHIRDGGSLDWHGDIFVLGGLSSDADAEMQVKDATLNVYGNLIILGAGSGEVEFEVDNGGTVNIDGSFFLATDWNAPSGTKAELEIEDGTVNVNGILTMLGPQIEIDLKAEAGATKALTITGALQIAVPTPATGSTKLEMEFRGAALEIHRDVVAMRRGVDSMQKLGQSFGIPTISALIDTSVEAVAYSRSRTPPPGY